MSQGTTPPSTTDEITGWLKPVGPIAAGLPASDDAHQALADAHRKVVNRLRRAQGQLTAALAAVERQEPCEDVVIQLAAVSKAVDRAGLLLISTAMQACLVDPENAAPGQAAKLEKILLSLA